MLLDLKRYYKEQLFSVFDNLCLFFCISLNYFSVGPKIQHASSREHQNKKLTNWFLLIYSNIS